MTRKIINLGTSPSGQGGDTNRSAFQKINENFQEIFDVDSADVSHGDLVDVQGGKEEEHFHLTGDELASVQGLKGASQRDVGTSANTVAAGDDSRIVNGQIAFDRGDHATAGYVKTDTKYTAGNGLTLSGTTFSLPVEVSGSGTYISNVEQTSSGIKITKGTPPNSNTTYAEIPEEEVTAGTASTLRAVTGRRLKQAVDTHGLKIGTTAATAAAGDDSRLSNSREWTADTVSQSEAETGTATTRRAWTAQRVRQSVNKWWEGIGTAFGKTLLGSANAADGRSALELGDAALRYVGTGTGQVMQVGAFGIGGRAEGNSGVHGYPLTQSQNITQVYRRSTVDGDVYANTPSWHFATDNLWGRLRVSHDSTQPRAWVQGGIASNNTGWTAELVHTLNIGDYILPPLGQGQSWHVPGAVKDVTYLNTANDPYMVSAWSTPAVGDGSNGLQLKVGDLVVAKNNTRGHDTVAFVSAVVPPGLSFRVEATAGALGTQVESIAILQALQ